MFHHLRLTRPLATIGLVSIGLELAHDRIIDLAVIKFTPDGQHSSFLQRLNPDLAFPILTTVIHRLGNFDFVREPAFPEVAAPMIDFLDGCDLAGFGIKRYDLPLLRAEFRRVGRELPMEGRAIIDVMQFYGTKYKRDLAAAVLQYCGREHVAGRAAHSDAAATADVLDRMLECHPDLPRTPAELNASFHTPNAVDCDGRFVRGGEKIVFAFGQYLQMPLAMIARSDPGYLEWMLQAGFAGDTEEIVLAALRQAESDRAAQPSRQQGRGIFS